nr:MAG TPA: hypothetical protein [Caudoviricetes sp.]
MADHILMHFLMFIKEGKNWGLIYCCRKQLDLR